MPAPDNPPALAPPLWTAAASNTADRLAAAVTALPRAGIHRWPVTVWPPASALGGTDRTVVIAEEHGGFAFGGNKVRQVDVLLGAALADGADIVITSAGPQSNLCRVVAAAARWAGVEPHLVLRGTPPDHPRGNQVLYGLTGARQHWVDADDPFDDLQATRMQDLAEDLRRSGRRPAVIDVRADGGTVCALAATAIVDELQRLLPRAPDRIVLAASAGNTAGGLVAGLAARAATVTVVAVSASGDATALRQRILRRARAALDLAGLDPALADRVRLEVTDAHLGGGHGIPTPQGTEAQQRTAAGCGLFLDLTYTAKAMAAVLADPRPGLVVFLHTGGGPGVLA